MPWTLNKSETIPLTSELISEFIGLPASPTERPAKQSRLKFLQGKIGAGLTVPFHWARAWLNGEAYRVNGQHSSTVLSQLNGSLPDGLTVHLDDYKVDDIQDLVLLHRQFDSRESSRSTGDVAGTYQGAEPALAGINRSNAKLAIEGYAWWEAEINGGQTPKGDDRYGLMHEQRLHPFIIWIGELLIKKATYMKIVPLVGAMYATFNSNPDKAREFWPLVLRGGPEGDEPHPAKALDVWLVAADEAIKKPKTKMYYAAAIQSWNAFVTEKSLRKIDWNFATKGTPFLA